MPRKKRICEPNLTYHTYSKCINSEALMGKDGIKKLIMPVLVKTMDKYELEFIQYVIMDNHLHFVIKTVVSGASISQIMQYVKSNIAQQYNRKMGRTGAFWNERFGDVIVEHQNDPEKYFNWLMWYLGFNPVRAGLAGDPRDYKYSAIMAYLDKNYVSPIKITLHKYFIKLGNTFEDRVEKFLEYEEAYRKRHSLDFLYL